MKKVYESPIMEVAVIRQQVMLSVSDGKPEQIGFDDDDEDIKEPID